MPINQTNTNAVTFEKEMCDEWLHQFIDNLLYVNLKDDRIQVEINDITRFIESRGNHVIITPTGIPSEFFVDECSCATAKISHSTPVAKTKRKSSSATYFVTDKSPLFEIILDSWAFYECVMRNFYKGLSADVEKGFYYFINKGVDVNIKSVNGETALHWAARDGNDRLIKLLLTNGADPNKIDQLQDKPINDAIRYDQPSSVKLLLQHMSKSCTTYLALFAQHKAYKSMQMLIDNGFNVNSKDNKGRTALYHAVWQGDEKMTSLLLNNGASTKGRYKTCHGKRSLIEIANLYGMTAIRDLLVGFEENKKLEKCIDTESESNYTFCF